MSDRHSTDRLAVVYCRDSDPDQGSIPEQIEWARSYAAAHELSILWDGPADRPFHDHGLSGDDQTRPGLARLEAFFRERHAKGQPVTRLIAWQINRVSRSDALDTFALYASLRKNGLRFVHTKDRTIDLYNALDRTLLGIEQDHKANPFLKDLAIDVLRGMAAVVRAGFWVGRTPFGYRLVKSPGAHEVGRRRRSGRLVIDEQTGPLVLELFRRYAQGGSTTELALWLTTQAKPPRAQAWCAQTVRQLLLNDVYVGTVVFGRRPQGKHARLSGGDGSVSPQQGAEPGAIDGALVVRNGAPAIVDEVTFRVCRERLEGGRRRGRPKSRPPLPLAGLGRCGHCGAALHALLAYSPLKCEAKRQTPRLACANRTRYGVGACPAGSTSTPHDPVLAKVLRLIAGQVLAGDFPERVTRDVESHAEERHKREKDERDNLTRRVGELDAALSRSAYRLSTVADDMVGAVQEGIRQVREELTMLRHRLAELDADRPALSPPVDPAQVRAFFDSCRAAVAVKVETPAAGALLNRLLAAITEGFTLYFKTDGRGRSTPDYVEVALPPWISQALATSAIPT